MHLNRRDWLATGALAGMVAAVSPVMAQQAAPAAPAAAVPKTPAPALAPAVSNEPPLPPLQGQITEEQLGQMLESLALKPEKKAQRYDFAFTAPLEDQQWEL